MWPAYSSNWEGYNPALGRWMKARIQINTKLTAESELVEIEGEEATKLR